MFKRSYSLMAPEGDATGGSGFIAQMAGEAPANTPADTQAAPAESGNPPANTGENPAAPPAGTPATVEKLGWTSAVTKELRSDPRFADFAKKYSKLDEAVKSAMDYEAKAADVPENPDDYELELDEELQYEEADKKEYQKIAKDLGLTKKQANALFKMSTNKAKADLIAYQSKQQEAAKAVADAKAKAPQAMVDTLKKTWGKDFDVNMTLANRGLEAYGGKDLIAALQESGAALNPAVAMHFANLGRLTQEDSALNRSGKDEGEKTLAERMYPQKKT